MRRLIQGMASVLLSLANLLAPPAELPPRPAALQARVKRVAPGSIIPSDYARSDSNPGDAKRFEIVNDKLDALNNRKDFPKPKVISLMTKERLGAAIALGILLSAISCCAVDFAGNAKNITDSNNTSALNATNSTLGPVNDTIDSILNQSTNDSGLWSWGDVPAGYTKKDGKIVPESYLDSDKSVMETPSQSSPNNMDKDTRTGGLLVRPK